MSFPLLIVLLGPVIGGAGWVIDSAGLFWTGVAFCVFNLVLNIASGVLRLPVLPVFFMLSASVFSSPWWHGLGAGIVVWTGFEAAGDLYARARHARRQIDS